jgi:hypothetical protein
MKIHWKYKLRIIKLTREVILDDVTITISESAISYVIGEIK